MCLERADERGDVGEYSEVVNDLRDAIVCENGELADTAREERVRMPTQQHSAATALYGERESRG